MDGNAMYTEKMLREIHSLKYKIEDALADFGHNTSEIRREYQQKIEAELDYLHQEEIKKTKTGGD